MSDLTELSALPHPLTQCQMREFISTLRKYGQEIILQSRQRLYLKPHQLYFVLDGHLAVSLMDRTQVVDYAFRLMPIGIVEQVYPDIEICYRATTPVRLIQISTTSLELLLVEDNIEFVRALLSLKSAILMALLNAYRERCTTGAYQTIRSLIEHYQREPQQLEGLANYILRRTHLSRGYVFSVLAKLKLRGVLSMEGGKLITLHAPLPEEL